ncbi:MAG: DUF4258 domain-containing protein [Sterolibacteriaceae bacterium]|nr:DUF4258 domain-containing protein [Sterolibacteriaceae bacterium]MBK9086316.1 DUF4258 domain-containing protein [Sterolibacteriaceae bacterium]
MPQLTTTRVRQLVRSLNYVVSVHAAEELEDDNLSILDLESVLLTGEIIERQRDRNSREVKTIVRGRTIEGHEAESVVKLGGAGDALRHHGLSCLNKLARHAGALEFTCVASLAALAAATRCS